MVTANRAKAKKISTKLATGTKYLSEDLAPLREILSQIGHWLTHNCATYVGWEGY